MLTFQGTCIHGGCYSANVLGCDVSIACGKCVGGGFYLDACLDLAQDSKCLHE